LTFDFEWVIVEKTDEEEEYVFTHFSHRESQAVELRRRTENGMDFRGRTETPIHGGVWETERAFLRKQKMPYGSTKVGERSPSRVAPQEKE